MKVNFGCVLKLFLTSSSISITCAIIVTLKFDLVLLFKLFLITNWDQLWNCAEDIPNVFMPCKVCYSKQFLQQECVCWMMQAFHNRQNVRANILIVVYVCGPCIPVTVEINTWLQGRSKILKPASWLLIAQNSSQVDIFVKSSSDKTPIISAMV